MDRENNFFVKIAIIIKFSLALLPSLVVVSHTKKDHFFISLYR